MMLRLRRVVLDIDKPIKEPSIFRLAEAIGAVANVEAVNLVVNEIDIDVMGMLVIVEGDGFDFAAVEDAVSEVGGVLHSVDQVAAGAYVAPGGGTVPKASA
jgi:hypothetical protein